MVLTMPVSSYKFSSLASYNQCEDNMLSLDKRMKGWRDNKVEIEKRDYESPSNNDKRYRK